MWRGGDSVFETLHSQIGAGIAIFVVGFAFVAGGETERIGAGAYILSLLASLLVQQRAGFDLDWTLMIIDVGMLAVYAGLTWKSHRAWPVWASALQALVVTSHVLKLMNVTPTAMAFTAVINLASYGILLALAVGTFWAWQEKRAASLA